MRRREINTEDDEGECHYHYQSWSMNSLHADWHISLSSLRSEHVAWHISLSSLRSEHVAWHISLSSLRSEHVAWHISHSSARSTLVWKHTVCFVSRTIETKSQRTAKLQNSKYRQVLFISAIMQMAAIPFPGRFQRKKDWLQRSRLERRQSVGSWVVAICHNLPDRPCQTSPMCTALRQSSPSLHSCRTPAHRAGEKLQSSLCTFSQILG